MMPLILVGSGKLSDSIETLLSPPFRSRLRRWKEGEARPAERSIVVHVGSGRELGEAMEHCRSTQSVLVEMATGSQRDFAEAGFPVILCPNSSLLLLKLMFMVKKCGALFHGSRVSIAESHQAAKKSLPGTAVDFAESLKVPQDAIVSLRNPQDQLAIGIDREALGLHAYHKIVISDDDGSEIVLETRVNGHLSYVRGLERLLNHVETNTLENRVYRMEELIERV